MKLREMIAELRRAEVNYDWALQNSDFAAAEFYDRRIDHLNAEIDNCTVNYEIKFAA